jgi:hypothetical protein
MRRKIFLRLNFGPIVLLKECQLLILFKLLAGVGTCTSYPVASRYIHDIGN